MKVKNKETGKEGYSDEFNIMSLSEIFVYFDDWYDTDFPSNYLFWLDCKKEWVEFSHPFIVTDNYNTRFREAFSQEEVDRGYFY